VNTCRCLWIAGLAAVGLCGVGLPSSLGAPPVSPAARGARCTIARVRAAPGATGRLDIVAADRRAIVWVIGPTAKRSLYACVPGTPQRHLIDTAVTGNGLIQSLADVRVAGPAIGYLLTVDDQFGSTVSLRVARADGSTETSELVGWGSDYYEPGSGPSELGSWRVDDGGDLLWSETTVADGMLQASVVGLAGTRGGPVDPVTLAVGGPFANLRLDAGTATWTRPGGTGRIDLRAATTLARPPHPVGTCDLLTRAETLNALGTTRLPKPTRSAGECDYQTVHVAVNLTQRYGPFAALTSAERRADQAAVSAGAATTEVSGIGDAAYLRADGLGPVELTVFRGAFEFSVEEFPGASPAGLERLATQVLANVGY
jgi:hypothetical protein